MKSFLEKLIKEEVRKIISEQEEEVSSSTDDVLFGKYLWAGDDHGPQYVGDGKKPPYEANTELERKFHKILNTYVLSAGPRAEIKMFEFAKNVLRPLRQQGKFSLYIDPPEGKAYRGMSIVSIPAASKILNLSEEELMSMAGKPQKIEINSTISPRDGSMSWSSNKSVATDFAYIDPNKKMPYASFVLVADPRESGNDFYLDIDQIAHNYTGFPTLARDEEETISIGPVKIQEAYILVSDYNGGTLEIRKKLDKLLPGLANNIVQMSKEIVNNTNEISEDNIVEFNKKVKNLLDDFARENKLDFFRVTPGRSNRFGEMLISARRRDNPDIFYKEEVKNFLESLFSMDIDRISNKRKEDFLSLVRKD